jgi:hypothetical protein
MKSILLLMLVISNLFSVAQPTTGLVAHYTFDGNANDVSGNGNNAVVYGAVLANDQYGNPNHAYQFDGIDDYIDLPLDSFLLNNYTYSICLTPTALPTAGSPDLNCFISIGSAPADQYVTIANLPASSQIGFSCGSYYAPNVIPPDRFSVGFMPVVNTPYNIVVTRSDSTLSMYIDEILINTVIVHTTIPSYGNGTLSARIGSRCNDLQYFQGIIDDVLIYNRVLTSQEITKLCENPTGINETTSLNNLNISPNPVHDILSIKGLKFNGNIHIYNSIAERIRTLKIQNENINLSTASFAPGIYYLFYFDDEKIFSKKFIKE